jgi:hypothetical protein
MALTATIRHQRHLSLHNFNKIYLRRIQVTEAKHSVPTSRSLQRQVYVVTFLWIYVYVRSSRIGCVGYCCRRDAQAASHYGPRPKNGYVDCGIQTVPVIADFQHFGNKPLSLLVYLT